MLLCEAGNACSVDETKPAWLVLLLVFSGILMFYFLTSPVHYPSFRNVVYYKLKAT